MNMTQVQDTFGERRNAYCLLALLSNEAKEELAELLQKLSRDLDDIIWTMPKDVLHITLCEIIQSKEYSQDKETLYRSNSLAYENLTAEILKEYSPISVQFDTIEVSSQAIIIKGRDKGSFQNIRRQLVESLPIPEETKQPPTIIHSTIARFKKEVEVDEVRRIVQKYKIAFEELVDEFRLIHLHATPLQDYETICAYKLG